jgi:hypothetical protein
VSGACISRIGVSRSKGWNCEAPRAHAVVSKPVAYILLNDAHLHGGENSSMNTKARLLGLLALLAAPALAFGQPYASLQLGYANADFPVGAPYNGVVKDSAPVVGIEATRSAGGAPRSDSNR